jgi:hypothetical protein
MHCHTTVFIPELDKFVVVFIDDIFVYLKNMEEHEEYLRLMLQRLRDHQVFLEKSRGGGRGGIFSPTYSNGGNPGAGTRI